MRQNENITTNKSNKCYTRQRRGWIKYHSNDKIGKSTNNLNTIRNIIKLITSNNIEIESLTLEKFHLWYLEKNKDHKPGSPLRPVIS